MKRIISSLIAIVLCVSMVVPAFAFGNSDSRRTESVKGVRYDSSFKASWDSYFDSGIWTTSIDKKMCWYALDYAVRSAGYGGFSSYMGILKACNSINAWFRDPMSTFWQHPLEGISAVDLQLVTGSVFSSLFFSVVEHSEYGYIIVESKTGRALCNSSGAFPYYQAVETEPDPDEPAPDGSIDEPLGGKWVRVDKTSKVYNIVSQAVLDDIVASLQAKGERVSFAYYDGNKYGGIQSKTRYENGIPMVYCDEKSRPYRMQLSANDFAVNQDNNYYTGSSGSSGSSGDTTIYDQGTTENNNLIDVENNTIWFPDGTLNYINTLLYDESTKTYYVDAHQEYNIQNNTYITNNYYYEYHINYTSITYIGASEEYNKTYELYYQLPDGRNSADLTAEELKALNVSVDVVPYIRSTDNTALRSLYHFDGNVNDSSYWNYATSFAWKKGASITYLESNAFNGCLYLDETEHEFELAAPSGIGSHDFTLQWRMYNSATPAPVSDSWVSIGSSQLFTFSGSYITFNGTQYAVPVGNWYEIALIRQSGMLRLYLNGIQVGSKTDGTAFSKTILFHFGSQQQTYKQLDELRLLNYALVKNGSAYTPTAVPYDTNLALVLPDSTTPVADEYWNFTSSKTNLLKSLGLDVASSDFLSSSHLYVDSTVYTRWESDKVHQTVPWNLDDPEERDHVLYPDFSYRSSFTQIFNNESSIRIARGNNPPVFSDVVKLGNAGYMPASGLFTVMYGPGFDILAGRTYTLSMVDEAGNIGSVAFTVRPASTADPIGYPGGWLYRTDFNGYTIGLYCDITRYTYCYLYIFPSYGARPFVYLELVEGDSTDLKAEHVTAIAPVNSDFKTPTLAVRTDLEITGHQIGGVRPSLPEKGLVWALVEGGRMTSLQIYNGQAWEAVDGRIWTGSRWVPYYAYDVLLLKDLYDVIESDPSQEYIYTQEGFWAWFQKAWNQQLLTKLDAILSALGGGSGSGGSGGSGGSFFNKIGEAFSDGLAALIKGVFDLISTVLEKILGLAKELLSFFFDFLTDALMSAVRGFFSLFSSTDSPLFGFFRQEGPEDENGEPTTITALPSGVAAVFAFFSGAVMALPTELRSLLIFGVALMFLFSVFKMVSHR